MLGTDGWRARIGLIALSNDWVAEPWLHRAAPAGVTIHTARIPNVPESAATQERHTDAALAMLASARVDVVVYGCTSNGMEKGFENEEAFRADLECRVGIPVVTAALNVVAALRHLEVARFAILSPYPKLLERVEREFFGSAGFEIASVRSLGLWGNDLAGPSPEQIYREARRAWDPTAEALFMSCTNFRSQDAVAPLEADLGVPVITSLTACLWSALRAVGVAPEVAGYGRLLG